MNDIKLISLTITIKVCLLSPVVFNLVTGTAGVLSVSIALWEYFCVLSDMRLVSDLNPN